MAITNIVGHFLGAAGVLASAIAWFVIWYGGSMPAIAYVTLVALPVIGGFIYITFRFKKYVTGKREKKKLATFWPSVMVWSPVILIIGTP